MPLKYVETYNIEIMDVSEAEKLDLISSSESNPVIVSGKIELNIKEIMSEIEIEDVHESHSVYYWAASFMGEDITNRSSWSISGNYPGEFEGWIEEKIFEKLKEVYFNPKSPAEKHYKEAADQLINRLKSDISIFDEKVFNYFLDSFKSLIPTYLASKNPAKAENIFLEALYQSLKNILNKINEISTKEGVILKDSDDIISFLKSHDEAKKYIENFLKLAIRSLMASEYSLGKSKEIVEEVSEEGKPEKTTHKVKREISFSDLLLGMGEDENEFGEEDEESYLAQKSTIIDKNLIDELLLEKDSVSFKEFNRKVNKIRDILTRENAINALKLFEKLLSIIEEGINPRDEKKLEEAGLPQDLESNKVWSVLVGLSESSTSEAFKKLRQVLPSVFNLSFKRKDEINAIQEFVDSPDIKQVKNELQNLLPEYKKLFKDILDSKLSDFEFEPVVDFFFRNKNIDELLDHYMSIRPTELANAIQKGVTLYKKYVPIMRGINNFLNSSDVKKKIDFIRKDLPKLLHYDLFLSKLNNRLTTEEWEVFNEFVFDNKSLLELVESGYDLRSLKKALEEALLVLSELNFRK